MKRNEQKYKKTTNQTHIQNSKNAHMHRTERCRFVSLCEMLIFKNRIITIDRRGYFSSKIENKTKNTK